MTVENQNMNNQPRPGENAPGAVSGMVCGIISVVICWLPVATHILGVIGIVMYVKAKKAIEADSQLRGKGMAVAGLVCGICGIVFGLFYLVYYIPLGSLFTSGQFQQVLNQYR